MSVAASFVAYPSKPRELANTITDAVDSANSRAGEDRFHAWEHSDIGGKPLAPEILTGIERAPSLIADISRLNFNVSYEIGYAIGVRKPLFLVRNASLASDDEFALSVGIFDTLGHVEYASAEDLAALLLKPRSQVPLKTEAEVNIKAPVYVLEAPVRTAAIVRIAARVKKARLFYRSFTPSEDARLSAIDAIRHVAESLGVLVPLLSPEYSQAPVHNIRAAFVAGLAHGMEKRTLILQEAKYPVPLDLRDSVEVYSRVDDIDWHIEQFAGDVYEEIQRGHEFEAETGSLLQQIVLGDPMAENEFKTLALYYVKTDEYGRALRGEVNLVVGRKGTGKTALFFQVRDRVRRDRRNVVIDLKPEGYQLQKLKENVLDYLSEGAKSHLITAFWEYLLMLEICRRILEMDRQRHRFDHSVYEKYRRLARLYDAERNVGQGDFSERLLVLSSQISDAYLREHGTTEQQRLTADDVTNLLHASSIRELKSELAEYLAYKERVLVLFDNLDKGWPPGGIASEDILILRCLIDAGRKVQREMRAADIPMSCIVFIRNDIYQLLMESTPDFGKESRASLDWSDPDLLRELLRRRLVQRLSGSVQFDQIWGRVCTSHYEGEETSQYFIDRSLMRPRNLLKLVGHCKGFAVNLDHERIQPDDIRKGTAAYSNDVVIEADREMGDVLPSAKGLLYQFVGENPELSAEELHVMLAEHGLGAHESERVHDLLLYSGLLGIRVADEEAKYVYDFGYDLGILQAVLRKNRTRAKYVLNPALWPALKVASSSSTKLQTP